MPVQLVRDAMEQSRDRDPLLNALALLNGSYVLAYMDLPAAQSHFTEGLAVFENVTLDARLTEIVRDEITRFAVPVHPELAVALYKQWEPSRQHHFDDRSLIGALALHGFTALALHLLEDLRYSAGGASSLIRAHPDPAFQVRVLRAAKARWHLPRPAFGPDDFYRLFSESFRLLDAAEASSWLDELLVRVQSLPLDRIDAHFSDGVHMRTFPDMHAFQLLNVLRALKPPAFVESALRPYPAVVAAAKDFPGGTDSIHPGPPPTPAAVAGLLSSRTSVERLLDEAHRLFLEDLASNAAPRALWPSGQAYAKALYWAGQHSGIAGAEHLQFIPDTDLAIRAAIALATGILGLPMHYGASRRAATR
jgi:hypothetical protein